MTRSSLLCALVLALSAAVACGGTEKRRLNGKIETPKLPPVKPEALKEFDAGMRQLRLGGPEAYERALPSLRSAVEIDGKLWEGWHNLGVVLFAQGDDQAAAEAFSKALDVNPAHTASLLARAEAYRRSGERSKARADYEIALKRDPENRDVYARQASLLRELGKYEDALDVLRTALREAGANASIYIELGLVYLAQGRDELAELVLTRAAKLNDKDPAIYNALALVAMARGEDQLAFERFDHATSLDPNFYDARYNVASVLIDAGDYQQAKAQLMEVVKNNPDDLSATVALGVAHRGLKEYDQAQAAWERVVKSAPRRSRVRGDALFNLAVLEMDHRMNEGKAKAALDRYLQEAPKSHPKRQDAENRRKEMGQ